MLRTGILLLLPFMMAASDGLYAKRGEPWIEIYGRDRQEADPDNVPVFINRVDERTFNGKFEVRKLAVGKHEIIFQTTRLHKAKRKAFTQTLTIDAKPCMRYYVSAYHVSRTSPRYEVRIYREETIKPCAKKHNLQEQAN